MQQTVIKGSVSRIHLRPFGGPTSFIRVEFKTLEFIESALTRSVLAMTEKGDHVELTFEAMGEFDPLVSHRPARVSRISTRNRMRTMSSASRRASALMA
jgi:hypothetical protein